MLSFRLNNEYVRWMFRMNLLTLCNWCSSYILLVFLFSSIPPRMVNIIIGCCCAPTQQPLKNIISSNKIVFCFDEMFEFHITKLKNWRLLKWWHSSSYWNMKFNVFKRNLCQLWISWQNNYVQVISLDGFTLTVKGWALIFSFYISFSHN